MPQGRVDLVTTPDAIRSADALVVPGQGAFASIATALDAGLREAILESIHAGRPYLGICLGMQVLFDESEEAPGARGLGVFGGHVTRLGSSILPHMGWNDLSTGGFFYFAHSYVVRPVDPSIIGAITEYGEAFASVVTKDNVLGVQFHPEKSQRAGLTLLKRFFGA